jgi:hypothetical protein
MRRFVGCCLLLMTCGVALASGRHEKWDALENLDPYALVQVKGSGKAGLDRCRVELVDDATLTCIAEGANPGRRLVYPRNAVREVKVWEEAPDRHIAIWVGLGMGFAIGGALCAAGGPGPFFACAAIGAGLGGAIAVSADRPSTFAVWWPGPPPPRARSMHWGLVYRVSAKAAATP